MAVGSGAGRPDWREASDYRSLLDSDRAGIAWEWLRRDPGYRAAAGASPGREGPGPDVRAGDAGAAGWGLHAFEDPGRPAGEARPIWRRAWLPLVLLARAERAGPASERFDLARFAPIATVVRGAAGLEHVVLAEGGASLRLDVAGASLLAGPARLAYDLAGIGEARGPLQTLEALLRLWRAGHLPQPSARRRNARLILLLRAWDAVQTGATQRDIAEVLVSAEAGTGRWRSEMPSVRSRVQRLVKGARATSRGGYRRLLRGADR